MKAASVTVTFFALFIFCYASINASTNASSNARGWNDKINWYLLNDGLQAAKDSNKPIMFVIHKTWCGACKRLKSAFSASKEIEELSSKFVMINIEDDEEPSDQAYAPDGGYIPRILFATSDGKIRNEVYNKSGNDKYKYFYPDAESVLQSMRQVANSN